MVRRAAPEYPQAAANRQLGGWVEIEFTVTEAGQVADTEVLGSTDEIFEPAALAALDRWRFRPHALERGPVPVRAAVRFTFEP